ncbi:HD domain-containing phosphohydrolase [Occallatibacter riparius]|uniref:Response regulator n=1 Tax=Occallatibacter riparius TaxID=1002689 RepID=A0A9J7BW76_9BACT|nr:HD domain-containing phosphohydrolase [Occallatibacter riparius]UWZ86967.1 response regulator [Occallatibacter riparius]
MALNLAQPAPENTTLTLVDREGRPVSRTRRAPHILVVDDEGPVRSMIGATLERQGYQVQLAGSGREATDALERAPFDLVLTDIVMQDVNGIALLERIRSQFPRIPVVMVSAIHDISVAIDSMRRGAYDYLLKPFEREHLVATVTRALEYRTALEENQNYQLSLEQVVQARTELLQQAMEDLEHSYDITLEALGDALDLKDSETEGHSKRVTAYTIALARAMGIKPAEIKVIARGAFLHDIGKMAIPDDILRKPGALSQEEQDVMREHCTRGYHILRKIPFLSEAAEIVFAHQEKFDGTGYPNGLNGAEIPIGARIFAVADALDAITSDRPYRRARSFDVAREEILRCSGTQFDPAVVEVFLKIPNELWHELRNEITGRHMRFSTFDISHAPMPRNLPRPEAEKKTS